ncbi:MAG TPA: FkbM family methyltransferase [Opitutaceae bacterium]|nr:FkbM family methyltransferase [Opitutaceae bacterium]
MNKTTLKRGLRYISRFGWRAGLPAMRIHSPSDEIVKVRLPGVKFPFWIRSGTSDVETFEEVFLTRQYALPFPDFEPAQILDLGANIGLASLFFATQWPEARILAVEPAGSNIGLLDKNIQEWPSITRLQAAVWAQPARVHIANPHDEPNTYRMTADAGESLGEEVPAYTVEQLIDRQGGKRIDLLKMDIEGTEAEIFRHGADWISRVSVLVIELHDRIVPGCAQALYRALQGRRFQQEIVGGNLAIDLR